ncbi:TlpA family protein disulfide reductase [Pontimicrobium aquaticum]|uniref:TlpA family protein disulfide reductase n=1 Tax=Pontimicrobium aquaticum TaxID=2565367 RepID=A0A4U0EL46_9FLAO|nr:TlpA disulfide reductase family protein [Pontimicrobium aquaticum]TJY32181.1 TlpA family protein disulfide reductase [Pontimicrobium aquaticum]
MKFKTPKKSDIIFLVIIVLLIVPQTRQPIQIALHSVLSKLGPSVVKKEDRKEVSYSAWRLRDLNGKELNFTNTKGKVVFINLWATWCPPCIAEFSTIQDLYNDYKNDVVFLLVSDESPATIKKFLNKKGYDIQVFNPLTKYPDDFNPRSIPRTYIIDKEGYIVVDKKGAANWNSNAIRKQLDKMLKGS